MSVDRAPKDASVQNLLDLCEVLREGEKTRDELFDEVQQGNTLIRDNIRYGKGLGFLTESDNSIDTTTRGVEASYNRDSPGELATQFQEGLKDYKLFNIVLEELASEDFPEDTSTITKSDVLRVFRTSAGLDGSDSTLGDAATTFIQTLEAAGLGNYVVGRGGKETRLEIGEGFSGLVESITKAGDLDENSVDKESTPQPQSGVGENSQLRREGGSPFEIKLELSGDEDPKNVEELVLGVRRGLSRDLPLSNAPNDTDKVDDNTTETSSENSLDEPLDTMNSDDGDESHASDRSLNTFVNSEEEADEK